VDRDLARQLDCPAEQQQFLVGVVWPASGLPNDRKGGAVRSLFGQVLINRL
jgi:hypothetical protein